MAMIQPINALTPRVSFRGESGNFENPVNRKIEKNLALMNAGGISAAGGAVMTLLARNYTNSWRHAGIFGVGTAAVAMMFLAPRFMYKAGINSYAKEKEMDVFTREKEVQKKLLSDVNDSIDNKKTAHLSDKLENYSKSIIRKAV